MLESYGPGTIRAGEREEREFVYSECVPACLVSRRTADTVVRGRQREAPTAAAAAAVRT